MRAARFSRIPVINAGDGGHQHPTQTLTDLLTILTRRGRLSHLKIGFCGDLKYGRTVHSLVNALARYEGNEFVFISPEELRVPGHLIENVVKPAHIPYAEVTGLEEAMADLDILYMTRIQKERFTDAGEYERLKGSYVLDMPKMVLGKADMAVLHPLPRVNEIALAVDDDPRAAYFEQAQNGVYVRMALIMTLLGLRWPSRLFPHSAPPRQRVRRAGTPAVSRLPKKSLCPCTSPTLTVCRAVCTASTKCRDLSPARCGVGRKAVLSAARFVQLPSFVFAQYLLQ